MKLQTAVLLDRNEKDRLKEYIEKHEIQNLIDYIYELLQRCAALAEERAKGDL